MGKSELGDPGQADELDPKGPNKFEPTTKAVPPPPGKAQSHKGHPHGGQKPQ